MKKLLVCLAGIISLLLSTSTIYAGNVEEIREKTDSNVLGHVVDARTGEHMPYVNVLVVGTTIGSVTDATGHYFLKDLPVGRQVIKVMTMGYKSQEKEVYVKLGKTAELNFELEEDFVALDAVVVSANRNETTRRLAPTLVNVMDMKLFERTNSRTLSEGLAFQPGLRVENNCQNCGFNQVRINGLDGPYTQILIDSRPVFSSLAGVYGLEQIPANMIERVEVMRGGGSALFGSSAIAGTINIITKEPIRNSAQIAHTISSYGSSSFENNTTMNASLVSDNHRAGLYVFGGNHERSGYDYDGDGFTELPKLRNQTAGFRSFINPSDYTKLTFEYHHLYEYRRGGDQLKRPPHEVWICEGMTHNVNSGNMKFDYFSPNEKNHVSAYVSVQDIKRSSYYGGGKDTECYGNTTGTTWVAGGQFVHRFDRLLFMPSEFTGGVEYNHDEIDDKILGKNREFNQDTDMKSVFLQNEWKNNRWSILFGGRFDKHNKVDDAIFSPRVNLRYNPSENINLRVGYSYGFRAPQAFDEELHVSNVGGEISVIDLSKDLKEEKSKTLNISADTYFNSGRWQGNLLVEGFYTDLTDAFELVEGNKDAKDVTHFIRQNNRGAKVYGVTLEGRVAYGHLLQLQAGATFESAKYRDAVEWSETAAPDKHIFRTPDQYGYFTLSTEPVDRFTISMTGNYTGKMWVPHMASVIPEDKLERTPTFFEFGAKMSYAFKIYDIINLEVMAGVKNMFDSYQSDFDKGKERDSGYIYGPMTPRSVYAGVKMSF